MKQTNFFSFSGERIDDMGFDSLYLIQKPDDFCYGIDAVLLADFAKLKHNAHVVDLGTGTGAIPLILSRKYQKARIIGVEIQNDACERAVRSVELNGLSERITIFRADVKELSGVLPQGTFDAVLSNPPYNSQGDALQSESEAKRIARHETTATLEDFMAAAAELLKDRGEFYLVHRPARLVDIFTVGRALRLEPKEIRFVHPSVSKAPNIVLVKCVKNGGAELRFREPLYVYDKDGGYTEEVKRIYEK